MRKTAFAITIFFYLLYSAGCAYDSREGDAKIEEMQTWYLFLTRPTDVTASCENAKAAALKCMDLADQSGAGGFARFLYTAIQEAAYSITVPAPQEAADICSVLLESPDFPDPSNDPGSPDYKIYTDATKICLLDCEKEHWQTMKRRDKCTAVNYPAALTDDTHKLFMSERKSYDTCIRNCFIRGTVLPPYPGLSTDPFR